MNIRSVTLKDVPALLKIYSPYVEQTSITFEYDVPSEAEFKDRVKNIMSKYPYLVAEENGEILGYTYASAFKTRAAYAWSVETSIYIRQDAHHRGIGSALYKELEVLLSRQNVCNLCACITYPNPSSIAFHEQMGYRTVAHFNRSGYKHGAWHDIVWMEKELCTHANPPLPFIPYPQTIRERSLHETFTDLSQTPDSR